jgi:hypothetical protein
MGYSCCEPFGYSGWKRRLQNTDELHNSSIYMGYPSQAAEGAAHLLQTLLYFWVSQLTGGLCMVHVSSIRTAAFVLWIHFTPHLVPILCTEVPSLYEQDAINGYVLQLAPEQKQADLFTKKPMWSAPFPTPAYKRNKFYHSVRFSHDFLAYVLPPVP